MRPRDDRKPVQVRNTLTGFVEFTMYHGQKVFINLKDIQWCSEHTAGKREDGCRVGVIGDSIYLREDLATVVGRITAEQYRQMCERG